MSLINFESSRVKEAERNELKKARQVILEKAESDYVRRKEKEQEAKRRGDDKWILPSVEERIRSELKKSKKKKRKKKKKKEKRSKRKNTSSSDSDSDSEEEEQWVEKASEDKRKSTSDIEKSSSNENDEKSDDLQEEKGSGATQRDEWMTLPGLFPSVSREQLRQQSGRLSKAEEQKQKNKYMIDTLGQSDRELNPYWKDGGTGLPEEKKENETRTLPGKAVGDYGVDWLRRALKRTKEQAAEEGRSVEAVAAERWGSLQNLEAMLAEAEERTRNGGRSDRRDFDKRQEDRRKDEECDDRKSDRNESHRSKYADRHRDREKDIYRERERDKERSRDTEDREKERERARDKERESGRRRDMDDRSHTSSRTFQKPRLDDSTYSSSLSKRQFQKPQEDVQSSERGFHKPREDRGSGFSSSNYRSVSGSGSWRKKEPETSRDKGSGSSKVTKSQKKSSSSSSDSDAEKEKPKEQLSSVFLTDKEMNELGAKLVKAEILGNEALAKELKSKLESARAARAMKPSEVKETESASSKEETVILTKTDSRGFVRPLQQTGLPEPTGGRRKKQKVDTHKDGSRVRYFPDDDQYSLKDLFEHEKLSTAQDQNEMFSKLAGKRPAADDMDDLFEEQARMKESSGKVQARERSRAIKEHKRADRAFENCNWCFDSKAMLKHLVIAIGHKVYLCLPPHQSLTDGHCLIVPMYHTTCATQLDEDVWSEVQTFKKAVTAMFKEKMDHDVVFFETAMHLNKFPHMLLECVPMEHETGDLAPIYFKKAIMECETEWSTNKKLVDLKGKDVRRAVPKGLPYFAVDFGLDPGFAHVIEDEKMFPRNFAQEIIGGMLDLDHSKWRKKRQEKFDEQRKKVLQFAEWWKPYDFTMKKEDSSDLDSD